MSIETRDADRAGVIIYRGRVFVWTLYGLSVWAEALDDPDTWIAFDYSCRGQASGDCSKRGSEWSFDSYKQFSAESGLSKLGEEIALVLDEEAYSATWSQPRVRIWPEEREVRGLFPPLQGSWRVFCRQVFAGVDSSVGIAVNDMDGCEVWYADDPMTLREIEAACRWALSGGGEEERHDG